MQIHELSALSGNPASGTSFVVDNGSTTRKIDYTVLAKAIIEQYNGSTLAGSAKSIQDAINDLYEPFNVKNNNSGFHNSIYRGRSLGSSFTEAQSETIKAGNFDNMFVGDYWIINDTNWRIAGFDCYLRKGQVNEAGVARSTHHVVIIPDKSLYSTSWNASNSTAEGYRGSAIRENIKGENTSTSGAEAKFVEAFGDSHVITYRNYYPTAYNSSGIATGAGWITCRVELMSEIEVFGYAFYGIEGKTYECGNSNQQFPLFRLDPKWLNAPSTMIGTWLRTMANESHATYISQTGNLGSSDVALTSSLGVRPFGLIS